MARQTVGCGVLRDAQDLFIRLGRLKRLENVIEFSQDLADFRVGRLQSRTKCLFQAFHLSVPLYKVKDLLIRRAFKVRVPIPGRGLSFAFSYFKRCHYFPSFV
jgi:hypothetical protein